MKKSRKSLMLLPLLAICLSGCYTIIPEDAPEEIEDEFTPEGSYTLPEEDSDYTESSSIPYESTEGDTESTGGDSSSSSTPSETPGGDSSSSSTPSETHEYSYSLQITNKEDLASLTLDENNSSSNIYTLSISLISYDYDIQLSSEAATEDDVIVTSSNEAAVIVDGLTLIPQVGGGETTISATWKLHSEATDSFAVTVDYIPYTPEESYEYKLVIENKEELGSTWKITDTRQNVDHTLEVKLYEYKYLDGDLADDYPIVKDASLSDVDISFTDDSVLGISTDSISLYPTGVGSTDITLTWKEHPEAYDSFSVIVEEVSYEYDYTLAITNSSAFDTDEDNVWRVGDSYKTLSVSLTSTTYTGSTDTSEPNIIDGDSSNVSVSFTPEDGSPENGLTVWGLNLMANAAGTYIVTATWIDHEEATDSITVTINEKMSTSYTMSVSSDDKSNMEEAWYVEDEESRSFNIDISADDGEAVDLPYNDSDIIVLHSSSQLQIDSEVSDGIVTITPIGITSNVTITLFVYWSLHSEAHITLTLTLNQHAYEISITNDTELALDWSVEDGPRTVEIETKKDGTTYSQDPYIQLIPGSNDSGSITIDGLNITPNNEGNPTVTAVWYKYDPSDSTYAESNVVYATSESVQLSIDENIKPVSISLSTDSITLNAYYDTASLSATVLGANNEQATEQGVTWSADTGIVLTDVDDDNSITVSVTGYNIEGTITCTSEKDPNVSATCSVVIGDQPDPDGPQANDPTYKLGCKKSDGSYVFFDGTISSNHLQITEDWEQAADVYVSPNEYEIGGNGCTLSFYDSNGTLQYLASSESTSSKGNMKLSTTPYRWVWDSYNGYSFFSAPAFEDRYIGLSSSNDFRTYAQSSLSSDAPVYPYAEIPEDYTYGTEEEPETGEEDGTYILAALCDNDQYRYFNGTVSSNHAQTTTTYSEATRVTIDGFDQTKDCSCILTYKDSSGSTKYLAYGGSGTNVSASSSSYTWNWSVEDGCFYASTDSTRYLSNQTGYNYFAAYNSNNGTYKVVPYAEDPINGSPTGLIVNSNSNQVIVGHELQLTATVLPEGNVNNSIIWSSSNTDYASVDQTGLVTGNAVCDSVTITATLDGYPEITDSITLTIVSEESKEFIESDQFLVEDYSSSYTDGASLDDVSFALNACSFKFNKNSGTATAYYKAGIRIYQYNQIIFTNPDPSFELIDTITITCTSTSYLGAGIGIVQNGSCSTSGSIVIIQADYSGVTNNDYDVIFQNRYTGSTNTQLRFTQIDITYKRA